MYLFKYCFRFNLGLAIVLAVLVGLPAAALAGLPNAVIGTGNINGVKALQATHRHTIYMSTRDKNGRSSCYGACLKNWTPVLTSSVAFARKGSAVAQSLLSTTRRRNGKLQVTYNHHPLYTYNGDYGPGYDNGQGCTDSSGHSWWMVSPGGKAVTSIFSCQGY